MTTSLLPGTPLWVPTQGPQPGGINIAPASGKNVDTVPSRTASKNTLPRCGPDKQPCFRNVPWRRLRTRAAICKIFQPPVYACPDKGIVHLSVRRPRQQAPHCPANAVDSPSAARSGNVNRQEMVIIVGIRIRPVSGPAPSGRSMPAGDNEPGLGAGLDDHVGDGDSAVQR